MTTTPEFASDEEYRRFLDEALLNCAREPIHQIGSIQPAGVVVAIDAAELVVRSASGNLTALFPVAAEAAIGRPVADLVGQEQAGKLRELIGLSDWPGAMIWSFTLTRNGNQEKHDVQLFRSGSLVVIEIERERPAAGDVFHDLFIPIRDALWKLDGEPDLGRYTQAVVEKVRLLTGFDRVMMYRFDMNWDGEVIAESKAGEVGSYLGNRFPASDIPSQARDLYTRNLVRLMADVDAPPVPLIGNLDLATGQPVDLTHSWLRSMSPVHMEYLRNMGVRASLTISLVQNNRLWGLIACHHFSPRYVSLRARELDEFIGRVVSLKLVNMDNAERDAINGRIRDLLYGLTERIRSTDNLDAAIRDLRDEFLGVVRAEGAVVTIGGRMHCLGAVPPEPAVDALVADLRRMAPAPVFHTDHVAELGGRTMEHQDVASGMMVAPLDHSMANFVMWFRPGILRTLRWAGKPGKFIIHDKGVARISPRDSFETWIETYREKSLPWSQVEIDAANSLSLALIEVLAQRALKSSEESYRLLAENSTDLIARMDLTGCFHFVSPASFEMLGHAPTQMVGRSLTEFIPAEDQGLLDHVLAELPQAGSQVTTIFRGSCRDGRPLWIEATLRRVIGGDGRDELVMNARDVTQRHTYQLAIEAVHRRNAQILDAAGEGVVSLDAQGNIIYVNEVAAQLLGHDDTGALGKHCCDFLCSAHGDHACCEAAGCPFLKTLSDGETRQGSHALRHRESQGAVVVDYVCTPLLEGGVITGCVVVFSEDARKRSGEQSAATSVILDQAQEAVMVTDPNGRITSVNRAFTEITGYEQDEAVGQTPRLLKSGVHTPQFYDEFWRTLRDRRRWSGEVWNRRKNGEIYPQWGSVTAVLDGTGAIRNYVAVFSDISKAKQAEEKLYFLANHDTLTGLPNRMQFSERLGQAIERAKRGGHGLAVAFLDLDRFKIINDTLGHGVGDGYLKRIAERLSSATRRQDTLARWGGDEFTVLLEDVAGRDAIAEAMGRLLACLAEPLFLEGHELVPTASIGISLYPDDGTLAGELVQAADAAMYRAKEMGRNGFEFYNQDIRAELDAKFSLAGEIRRALHGGELRLYYQPQVHAGTGQLIGVEALARWQHPVRGLVGPAEFIPMAEELGVIGELGDWVLKEACRQLREWRDRKVAIPRVSINVAPAQIKESFVESVAHALRETGVPPACLELEITEGALEVGEAARTVTRRLRDLGVLLSVDDFGTGYSSLSHLKLFPITCFKIDKSFIDGIPDSREDVAIVNTILALGTSLRVEVVAEGVETAEQVEFLRSAGVTNIQGYFYGRPMPAANLAQLCLGGHMFNGEAS